MMFARYLRVVTAVVILAAILGGLPIALSRFGTWPITGVPSVDQVRDLPSTIVSDTAIFGVLTVLAWIALVLFAASFLSELAAGIAGRQATRIPLAGPLQANARRLVAALLMSVSIAGPMTSMAGASVLPPSAGGDRARLVDTFDAACHAARRLGPARARRAAKS